MASQFKSGPEGARTYREEELLPLSGLQHMVFCDRQAALIHIDGTWIDNAFTVEGSHLHRLVDGGDARVRGKVRIARSVTLVSYRLGLTGKADVVELLPVSGSDIGVEVQPFPGRWMIKPVEYKRGKPKGHHADEVQLCAQAICLEEELGLPISEGSLFYGSTRRRQPVRFTTDLRRLTEEVARSFHDLVRTRRVPVRHREAKCKRCSLLPACLPPRPSNAKSAKSFLHQWIDQVLGDVP